MASGDPILIQTAELARKHWPTYYALFLIEILMLLVMTGILKVLEPEFTAKISAYIIIAVITFFVWSLSNRLPKTRKGKVGFAISISTGDESERKKILEDFIITIQELLRGGLTYPLDNGCFKSLSWEAYNSIGRVI